MPDTLTAPTKQAPTKPAPPKIEEWPVKEPEVPSRRGNCPDYDDDQYRQWGK